MSSIVVARDLSVEFSNGSELFQNLNLSLDVGRTALVGPNGVGKTCLAKLLVGEFEPTNGVVRRHGSVKLVRQREEPRPITVAECLAEYEWSMLGEQLLQHIDRDVLCTDLSGGQWMRVRLARALSADFLILDEPTNDLDREGRDTIMQFLRLHAGGILLISHDRECLELCEDILELSNRGLAKFSGGWVAYLESRAREQERLGAALDRAKRERDAAVAHQVEQRARQEKRNRRGADAAARGGAPKILLGARKLRAQATTNRVDATVMKKTALAVRAAHEAFGELKVDLVMYSDVIGRALPTQKLVADARDFNVRFQDWIYAEDLTFSWRGNIRVAVQGANGSGKSTLLSALLGQQLETRGELRRGELTYGYIDQRRSALDDAKSVFDNIRAVSASTDTEIRNQLARFLFTKDAVFQKVSDLSGGERLRAALARGLLSADMPELLVLDEPTNNLDRTNIEFLERIVSEFQGAVVIVSHDERFLTNCGIDSELRLR
jgi:ATPase subunit of ABC transporter with duplicated ATPase domains